MSMEWHVNMSQKQQNISQTKYFSFRFKMLIHLCNKLFPFLDERISFLECLTFKNTVCSIWFGLRNEAIVSLIWDFWCPKGLLCDPKTGRKLLLGQKYSLISFKTSQATDCQKEESAVLRMKFRVTQNSFLLHVLNFEYHRL